MKNRANKLLAILCVLTLLLGLSITASAAEINPVDGIYGPVWSPQWTSQYPDGMWQGFYILKSDNTLRTDLIAKSTGEWSVPGGGWATIWEGNNIIAPSDTADVGYILNCVEGGEVEITVNAYMETPGCTEVTFGIYKNGFGSANRIYPASGGEETLASGDELNISEVIKVEKGDKLYFRWHSPVEVANSPRCRFRDIHVRWLTVDGAETPVDPTEPQPTEPAAPTDPENTDPTEPQPTEPPVNDGLASIGSAYVPHWSEQWTASFPKDLWKGFYILKEDNTLRTDLIMKSDGCWSVPGGGWATIWEGINIIAPSDAADVGYMLNCVDGGQIQIVLQGYMEQPGCTEVTFGIYKNGFGASNLVYPESGEAVLAEGGELDIDMILNVNQGDKIYFRWHSPVEVAASPNFRFTAFSATWLSIDNSGNSGTTDPTEPGGDDDIIIGDDDDSYYLTSKYQDVTIDEENGIITLTKKLTLKDFKESFDVKINHTFKVIDTLTTKEVTDDTAIITGDMICRIFNSGTPITNLDIEVTYDVSEPTQPGTSDPAEPDGGLSTLVIVLIAVGAVAVIAVVVIIVIKKKKGTK